MSLYLYALTRAGAGDPLDVGLRALLQNNGFTMRDNLLLSPPLDLGPPRSPATRRTSVRPFSLIAATWRGDADRDLRVRTRSLGGGWSPWREVHPLHEDGPDPGSDRGAPPGQHPDRQGRQQGHRGS